MLLVVGKGKTGSQVINQMKDSELLAVCDTKQPLTLELAKKASCIVVFVPTNAFADLKSLLELSEKPVVIGTSGINLDGIIPKAPWIIGSNFSVGMNLMYKFARELPKELLNQVKIEETHHVHKQDSPSGSALYLKSLFPDFDVKIDAKREGDAKGEHKLTLKLEGETLSVHHKSLDRSIYAKGALLAARNIEKFSAGIYRFEEIFEKFFH
ncbi:MAG: hypothetical protein H6850_00490 [Alphaproteobacteria bacterium]|nr:MAG: hypothetical protein H6850_00490 [Alphaproteobacteria bacterium]